MKIKPLAKQLEFLNLEFGVFLHFGIRTFYETHKDGDMKIMDICNFNPAKLDCEQWISTIKQAGAKYSVLVAKHHDGFANWPSKYTDYSVANAPWKNGKGDIVKEYVEACRKYDIKVGIYYSPAEFGSNSMSSKGYDDYFINQISELLTNYGKIDYLWFDGFGSEDHQYDSQRIIKEIRRMQPEILIFNMWDPDVRWGGNESGIAPSPCFNTVDSVNFSVKTDKKEDLSEKMFLPAECDCRIRLERWFYSENDEDTLKTVDELMGLYYYSVGRGANLLINIGPDRNGLLPHKDADRIIEFGKEIRRRFSKPIPHIDSFIKNENKYICQFDSPQLVNHVVIREKLDDGESIEKFKVYIMPYSYGEAICVYEGCNIGHKAICQFPAVNTKSIVVEIVKYSDEYSVEDISVYYS